MEDDIEKLAEDTYREFPTNPAEKTEWTYNRDVHCFKKRKAFKKGYNKAKETFKYTEKDIKNAFYKGFDKSKNDDANCFTAWREEGYNLLNQTKELKEIEFEMVEVIFAKNKTIEEAISLYLTEKQVILKVVNHPSHPGGQLVIKK